MCLLLESVKISGGFIHNLRFHQERVDRSSRELFGTRGLNLSEVLANLKIPCSGTFKGRIVCDRELRSVEIIPYVKRKIVRVVTIDIGDFSYVHKFLDRKFFNDLKSAHPEADEFILHREGWIKDSTFSNLAFFDGSSWHTPANPLLMGTKRQQLLGEGKILPAEIRLSDLSVYTKMAFINAMNDLDVCTVSLENISHM